MRGFRESVLSAMPGGTESIVRATGLSAATVKHWIRDAYNAGDCHITKWRRVRGTWTATYSAGAGQDAKCEVRTSSGVKLYDTPPSSVVIVFDSLPGGLVSLSEKTDLSKESIRDALRKLHAEEKIYIYGWERHCENYAAMPLFMRGPGVDVICDLKKLTREEILLRYEDKVRPVAGQKTVRIERNRKLVFDALPGRFDTICESTGLNQQTVRRWLASIHAAGESHILKWKKTLSSTWVPCYAPGPGEDAPCDFLVPSNLKGTISYVTPPTSAQIVFDALPGSLTSIVQRVKLAADTVRKALRKLHSDESIHICDWEHNLGNNSKMPIFAKGKGEDAPCHLRTLTSKEAYARKRAMKKASMPRVFTNRELVLNALPGRMDTVMSSTGLSVSAVRRWLKDIYEAKESHISGWKKLLSGAWIPRYSRGPGIDAKCDFLVPQNVKKGVSYDTPPTSRQMILDALPGSSTTIIQRLKLSDNTVRNGLKKLHEERVIRIAKWEYHKSQMIKMPVFAKGSGPDAVCRLKDYTPEEIKLRKNALRQERRALAEKENRMKYSSAMDPDGWDTYNSRKDALEQAEKAKQIGDPMVMALFGIKAKMPMSNSATATL